MTSIQIMAVGASVGSVPKMVEVPASTPALSTAGVPISLPYAGYNSLYAYSVCATGEKTVMSNQLSVFYLKGSPAVPAVPKVPTGVFFVLDYSSTSSDSCTSVDEKQICDNVVALQSGGTCSLLSESPLISGRSSPFSYFAVGSVEYQTGQEASSLVQGLDSNPSSLYSGLGCGTSFTGVTTTIAVTAPLPNPTITPDAPTIDSAAYQNDCAEVKVVFTPPADTTGIVAYGAYCKPGGGKRRRGLKISGNQDVYGFTEAGSTSIILSNPPNIGDLECRVRSYTINAESAISTNFVITSGGPCL